MMGHVTWRQLTPVKGLRTMLDFNPLSVHVKKISFGRLWGKPIIGSNPTINTRFVDWRWHQCLLLHTMHSLCFIATYLRHINAKISE